MKLELNMPAGLNVISSYGPGYVMVNQMRYEKSLIVTPTRVVEDWHPARVGDLDASDFEFLLGLSTEIVLLGTGVNLQFPHPRLAQCLRTARIGLEVMDNGAACRTYNVLAADKRNVAAALLLG